LIKSTEKYLRGSLDKSTVFTYHEMEIICTEVCRILLDSLLSEQWTESYKEKGQEQEGESLEEYLDLPEELIETFHLKTIGHDKNKEIYYYNPKRGVYLNNGHTIIASELEKRYTKELDDFRRVTAGLTKKKLRKWIWSLLKLGLEKLLTN
jgi:hypothetical protein